MTEKQRLIIVVGILATIGLISLMIHPAISITILLIIVNTILGYKER